MAAGLRWGGRSAMYPTTRSQPIRWGGGKKIKRVVNGSGTLRQNALECRGIADSRTGPLHPPSAHHRTLTSCGVEGLRRKKSRLMRGHAFPIAALRNWLLKCSKPVDNYSVAMICKSGNPRPQRLELKWNQSARSVM